MKTILYINHTSIVGGASYCLLSILRELDRMKYLPKVMLKDDGPLVSEIERLGIEVIIFPEMDTLPYNRPICSREAVKKYSGMIKSIRLFKKKMSLLSVDALYLNTLVLVPYLQPAKEMGLRTIIHIREHWPLNEHRWQLRRIQRMVTNYADEVIAINSYSASMFPERKAVIIHDWIDFEDRDQRISFDEIFGEDCSNLKVFLSTGGMQVIKGTYEITKAFVENIKGDDKRLLLLGVDPNLMNNKRKNWMGNLLLRRGNTSLYLKMQKLISADTRIKCIPSTYKIKDIYRQAYCNVSYFTIPHANLSLAECTILGTLSVAARTSESEEYSLGGELSILFEQGDYDSFVQTLLSLNGKYAAYKDKILKRSHEIASMFDKNRNSGILNSVYKKLFN